MPTCVEGHVLPLLADPRVYVACRWDLVREDAKRAYWLQLFRGHFPSLVAEARRAAGGGADIERRIAVAQCQFDEYLDAIAAQPDRFGRLDILRICQAREEALRAAGIDDAYRVAKRRENDVAMKVLPQLLAELDALPPTQRTVRLIEGVFAGNIFDLGATDTEKMFRDKSVNFADVRRKLKRRPWLVDDLDVLAPKLNARQPYRCALLFVDNAGSDIVLGMVPLARELLRRGVKVILTANTNPSLNDVTHQELLELVNRIAAFDAIVRDALAAVTLRLVPSGNGLPLIDLSCVSAELVEAVKENEVDLVVLEGMGRAIESNFDAKLTCDVLKIAMVKDRGVADALGGELYDLVLRVEKAVGTRE